MKRHRSLNRSTKELPQIRKLLVKLFHLCDRWLGKLVKLLRPHQYPQLRSRPYTPEQEIAPSLETVPGKLLTVPSPAKRSDQVRKLLEEAWNLGHQTYPALMTYVEQETGESCSRRTIAAWKKSRTAA